VYLSHQYLEGPFNEVTYTINVPVNVKRSFTDHEKMVLRPIAETLAMLDGNAFFTEKHDGVEHYEYYLPEAWALFEGNGGMNGWACEASWAKPLKHESPAVEEAYNNYLLIKRLCQD
jgi:hypothetical protein